MSSRRPLHQQVAQNFDERYKRKQRVSQNIPFGSLGTDFWEPNIYMWLFFFESSIKFLKVRKTFARSKVFVYLFTHTNIVFLFKHLPTEIVIFKNVFYLMKCFSYDSFSSFQEQVLLIFHLLFWFHVKFRQVIQGY